MKLASWNVNGLRACMGTRGLFLPYLARENADIYCLQETKLSGEAPDLDMPGYQFYWNYAQKKGYSGTAVLTRRQPLSVTYGIGMPEHDAEGRVITLDFGSFCLVCAYVPNSQRGLLRLPYRMTWERDFRAYLCALDAQKPVIMCGDLNVAHEVIDIKNAKANRMNAGFTDEERGQMTELLRSGFADSFRRLHPDARDAYTWWSYFGTARERNIGWRIDYFIVSERLLPRVSAAEIRADVLGSDHCPVTLELEC
ncbi:MAG: exodeoxyribonuclease III [Oscillospiraceae bacterium]|jgi:exodeoxyribonuclease-3|nr:exodeoxyribonuclease III [Oscillospiraceae bacterium]